MRPDDIVVGLVLVMMVMECGGVSFRFQYGFVLRGIGVVWSLCFEDLLQHQLLRNA